MNDIKETPPDQSEVHNQNNKLLEFQQRVSAISKDSVNPFFKSKYFDVNTVIDTIKPILNEVGLVVTQPFDSVEGRNYLYTAVWDHNLMVLSSKILLPEISDVQKFGAAVTYFRRYSLVSLLLLQGEDDDDGNRAVKQNPAPSKTFTPKKVNQPIEPPTPSKYENIIDTPTTDGKEYIEEIVPGVAPVNTYQKLLDQINNAKTEKELDAISDSLKYYKKQLNTSQWVLLRNAGKQKRVELDPIQMDQGDYPA